MKKFTFLILSTLALLASCGSDSKGQLATVASQPTATSANGLERETLAQVNRYRASKGLPAFQFHEGLQRLAQKHSTEMLARNEMGHFNFQKRAAKSRKHYRMGAMSENLHRAWGVIPSARSVTTQWANSPKHRDNMEGNFTHAGISMVRSGTDLYTTLLLGQQVTGNSGASSHSSSFIF